MKKLFKIGMIISASTVLLSCDLTTNSTGSNTNINDSTKTKDSIVSVNNSSWLYLENLEEEYQYNFNSKVTVTQELTKATRVDTLEWAKDSIDLKSKQMFEKGYYPKEGGWSIQSSPLTDENFFLLKFVEGMNKNYGRVLAYNSKYNAWILDRINYDSANVNYRITSDSLYTSQNELSIEWTTTDTLVKIIGFFEQAYSYRISGDTLTLVINSKKISENDSNAIITNTDIEKYIRWVGNPPSIN